MFPELMIRAFGRDDRERPKRDAFESRARCDRGRYFERFPCFCFGGLQFPFLRQSISLMVQGIAVVGIVSPQRVAKNVSRLLDITERSVELTLDLFGGRTHEQTSAHLPSGGAVIALVL